MTTSKLEAIKNYSNENIQTLEGLEAVRKRPAMYIGNTHSTGLNHIVFEIFDNAVDEALGGFCDVIEITFNPDGSVTISDNGRGIPPQSLETIFTTLHAGGKFDSSAYKSSGGLHGVGTSVTNAMSKWLEVEVYRFGETHTIRFENGGKVAKPLKTTKNGNKDLTGTKVSFMPDDTVFSTIKFNVEKVSMRARETAFLNSNLKIIFNDFRDSDGVNNETQIFDYNGMMDYLAYLSDGSSVSVKPQEQVFIDEETGIEALLSFQWIENDDNNPENVLSYVNNIRTRDGGTHETGFKTGLTRAFNQYGKDAGLLKGKYNKVVGEDIRDGLVAIISVKIPENILEFESQTKDKLGTYIARSILEKMTYDMFIKFLSANVQDAEYLIERAIKYQKAKDDAKRLREASKKTKKNNNKALDSQKLTEPSGKDKDKWELFIVEGNSAAGSAKVGRFNDFQGVLALRGKVKNTQDLKSYEALLNEELMVLTQALGCDVGSKLDLENLRYDKVIIFTDADVDGSHIQVLLLTFFFKHMKKLVETGHVYIAQPPLYGISLGGNAKNKVYAWTQEELREKLEQAPSGSHVQRFKGLGEMDAVDLQETSMNPDNRKLLKVSIDDVIQAQQTFETLMGDKVPPRRTWIEQNVVFRDEKEEFIKDVESL